MKFLLMIWCIIFVTDVIGQTVVVNSDGTHSVIHGNVIVNSNGTHSTIHGNVIVNSDGTHSTVHGNVIVNPDGTHSTVHGNVIANPEGTHSTVVENDKTKTDRATEREVYKSETLAINQISEHVYQHISFLDSESFGNVSCNGMIVADENEAIIFDTPTDNETSRELINWIKQSLKCEITAVIPTHYHIDNIGGLDEFHRQGIASYAYNKTIQITEENALPVPQHGFDRNMELKIGNEKVHIEFFGEGHTCDNIVGYFPLEEVMFGGCLIKEMDAEKGNLAEANIKEWSETVRKIKMKYPRVKKIIVGHGKSGGLELLDYTINLFE